MHQPGGRGRHPDEVQAWALRGAGFGHQGDDGDQGHHDDGHVDQEHPAPPVVRQQPTTQDGADREGHEGGRRHDPHGLGSLPLAEQHREDGERHDDQPGAGEADEHPGGHELAHRCRIGTSGGSHPEEGQGDEEDLLAAVTVAQKAGREHRRGQHEEVPRREPLEVGLRRMQRLGQRGQGHAEHGAVHTHRQHGEGQGSEREPSSIGGRCDGCWCGAQNRRHGVAPLAEEAANPCGATDPGWSPCPNQASPRSIGSILGSVGISVLGHMFVISVGYRIPHRASRTSHDASNRSYRAAGRSIHPLV